MVYKFENRNACQFFPKLLLPIQGKTFFDETNFKLMCKIELATKEINCLLKILITKLFPGH